MDGPGDDIHLVQLACPATSLEVKEFPDEAQGLRQQYLEALDAYKSSIGRRNALQAELEDLRREHIEANESEVSKEALSNFASEYMELQSQRQHFRKLEAIRDALSKLTEASPQLIHSDLRTLTQDKLGHVPEPPAATLEAGAEDPEVEKLVFQLKKELVYTKQRLDQAESWNSAQKASDISAPSLQAEVHALRCARDELIAWIEGELAKIPEDSQIEYQQSPKKQGVRDQDLSTESWHETIEQLYGQYVERRKACVAAVDALSHQEASELSNRQTTVNTIPATKITSQSQPVINVSTVLPHVPLLLQLSREDKEVVQQTTHLRRQLAASTDDSRKTLIRLADESHMVPPRSDSTATWSTVARDATKNAEELLDSNLTEGEKSVRAARSILEDVDARREAFNLLRGTIGVNLP